MTLPGLNILAVESRLICIAVCSSEPGAEELDTVSNLAKRNRMVQDGKQKRI